MPANHVLTLIRNRPNPFLLSSLIQISNLLCLPQMFPPNLYASWCYPTDAIASKYYPLASGHVHVSRVPSVLALAPTDTRDRGLDSNGNIPVCCGPMCPECLGPGSGSGLIRRPEPLVMTGNIPCAVARCGQMTIKCELIPFGPNEQV